MHTGFCVLSRVVNRNKAICKSALSHTAEDT
jgi:hypothetical protein